MSIRKIMAMFSCIAIIPFAVSCKSSGKNETMSSSDIKDSFSCNATITYGELQASSSLKRYGKGMWENEFSSPDTLAGVKLTFDNDEVNASYKGLAFSVPKSAMPFQSMLCCLIEAADIVYESSEIVCSENDGILCYEGSIEQGEYKICFNSETGFIQSFSMPNMKLEIEFTDCSENSISNIETTEVTGIVTDSVQMTESTDKTDTTQTE